MSLWKVTERLYSGPHWNLETQKEARSAGITHIINVAAELPDGSLLGGGDLKHLKIATYDDFQPKTALWFTPLLTAVNQILADPSARLLIHCLKGHHRSASATYLVLRSWGLTPLLSRSMVFNRTEPRYGADVDRYLAHPPTHTLLLP